MIGSFENDFDDRFRKEDPSNIGTRFTSVIIRMLIKKF